MPPGDLPMAERFGSSSISIHGRSAWRAQVGGLNAAEAQGACAALARKKTACFVLRPESGQLASR